VNVITVTSDRLQALGLVRATLLVDETRVRTNIQRFVDRAHASGVLLRPHFKTHQSAVVGDWIRQAGIERATVSSLGQAEYFCGHGWLDLTLAVGANPREAAEYDRLAACCDLGLCFDDPRAVVAVAGALDHQVGAWIELDPGYGRTGVPWHDGARLVELARAMAAAPGLEYRGLLAHAGHSYAAAGPAAAALVYTETLGRLQSARSALVEAGLPAGSLSAGDTPGFAAVDDWSGLDEARPGNFVFHDLMQLSVGACTEQDLACAVACPVIGVYPERGECVVHAGAVHLSKEHLATEQGPCFGRLLTLDEAGFGSLVPGWRLTGLSQEHGIVTAPEAGALADLQPGDLMLVAPVHSCLACEQFGAYRDLKGNEIGRYRRC